jgi:hypothetical protein
MSDLAERLAANLKAVRRRIALAAKCCDRDPDSIKLVAVTKGASIDAIRAAIEAGCLDLGESRPQELERKAECRWCRWCIRLTACVCSKRSRPKTNRCSA